MLVDIGPSDTLLSDKFVNTLAVSRKPTLIPIATSLITATGEGTPRSEQSETTLPIGSTSYEHNVLVADINNNGILSLDFLKNNYNMVNLSTKTLSIGSGEEIPCCGSADNALAACWKIAVGENIKIPPKCEMINLEIQSTKKILGKYGVLGSAPKFVERKGLLVTKSVVDVTMDVISLRLINLLDQQSKV